MRGAQVCEADYPESERSFVEGGWGYLVGLAKNVLEDSLIGNGRGPTPRLEGEAHGLALDHGRQLQEIPAQNQL